MMADETRQLLRKFSGEGSEAAFRELVRRHSPLVYGTALRMLAGDRAAAQDVTQEVFTLLARKAGGLGGVVLAAWLYRQTCRRASNHVRTETRRKQRELVAADQMNPDASPNSALTENLGREIDAALHGLPSSDRDALVLRYFEGQDFRKLGATLGTTEEAARKRVARAVDKLAASLRKRGIAVGSTSLGTTMTNLGAVAVPSSLVEQVTVHALKAAALGGSPWGAKWLKPAAAGVLVTSLVAGTTLVFQSPRTTASPAPAEGGVTASNSPRRHPENSPTDDLIAEIKRLHAGPRHALTTLRLRALLERVEISRLPDFFLVAHERLTPAEQASCFELLLERWMQSDPDAALTFMAGNPLWKKVNASEGTSLLVNLFEPWARRDVRAAQSWLLLHWSADGFREKSFEGTLGEYLALITADRLLLTVSAAASFDFIQSIPDEPARRRALLALSGESPRTNGWMNAGDARLMELHREFLELADPVHGRALAAALWKKLLEYSPDKVARLEKSMAPADRFIVRIGSLGVTHRPGRIVPTAGGGQIHHMEKAKGLTPDEEQKAIRDGLAAGLSRGEVMEAIGTAVLHQGTPDEALGWIDRHRDDVQLDALLLEKVRGLGGAVTAWSPGKTPEAQIIRWASRMSDTATSRPICRGAFRRLLLRSHEEALRFLKRDDLPAPLKQELESILNEPR